MPNITVELGEHAYKIEIARGLLSRLGSKLKEVSSADKVAIITDTHVAPLYSKIAVEQVEAAGFKPVLVIIEAGEEHKNLATLSAVYDQLAAAGLTRKDLIVTLGGGVVGDLGGFAAASFLRGIAFVQVPTTILSQIDSSVGGKVAVDLPSGKNLVGSFYQPKAVLIDPNLLASLPTRYLHDGLAEVIKTAAFGDEKFFALLESCQQDGDIMGHIEEIIATCCTIKAKVVGEDELDLGARMVLNFGHTIGHAVEQSFGYEKYTHGEGVAIGMVRITGQTEQMGLTAAGTTERLSKLLARFGLPTTIKLNTNDIIEVIKRDKKKRGDSITLVVVPEIGKGSLVKIPFSDLPKYIG